MRGPRAGAMFAAGRYSIPRPVTRNLEDLDSVQSVLLHRSAAGRGREAGAVPSLRGSAAGGFAASSPGSGGCGGERAPRRSPARSERGAGSGGARAPGSAEGLLAAACCCRGRK